MKTTCQLFGAFILGFCATLCMYEDLGYCSQTKSIAKPEIELEGVWESGCTPSKKAITTVEFSGRQMMVNIGKFSDAACKAPILTSTLTYTFKTSVGSKALDMTVVSVMNTPAETKLTEDQGTITTPGVSKDITGKEGLPAKGVVKYSIYQIKGSTLYLGEGDGSDSPKKRPSQFSPIAYTKTSKPMWKPSAQK